MNRGAAWCRAPLPVQHLVPARAIRALFPSVPRYPELSTVFPKPVDNSANPLRHRINPGSSAKTPSGTRIPGAKALRGRLTNASVDCQEAKVIHSARGLSTGGRQRRLQRATRGNAGWTTIVAGVAADRRGSGARRRSMAYNQGAPAPGGPPGRDRLRPDAISAESQPRFAPRWAILGEPPTRHDPQGTNPQGTTRGERPAGGDPRRGTRRGRPAPADARAAPCPAPVPCPRPALPDPCPIAAPPHPGGPT